jgi:rare lipoprotein A
MIVHGCGSKKTVDTELPAETDIRINEIQIKEAKTKKEEKERRKHKGRKRPATQRPYVIKNKKYYPVPSADGYVEKGVASWYGGMFHGRKTANGETYNMRGDTAAHKTLPMNTILLVENLVNGKNAVVRINDRGPFVSGRIIDLSYTTAQQLGIFKNGTEMVRITAWGEEDVRESADNTPDRTATLAESKRQPKLKQAPKKNKNETEVIQLELESEPELESKQKRKKLIAQDFDKGNFYIQVGAFEHKKAARTLARTFADKGRDIIIQQFPAAGIRLFRVMVFSGTSLKAAKMHKEKLEGEGFSNALVIARDKKPKITKELTENRAEESKSVPVLAPPQATGG